MERELTMSELLSDPLIRVLLKADGISLGDFSDVIHKAAARLKLPPHAPVHKDYYAGPRELIWQESAQTGHDSSIEIYKPAFSSPEPAFI